MNTHNWGNRPTPATVAPSIRCCNRTIQYTLAMSIIIMISMPTLSLTVCFVYIGGRQLPNHNAMFSSGCVANCQSYQ